MSESTEYYIVRARAVPEVLRGVARANQLLASGKVRTVNEAAELAGISRSSYYKYKDDIFPLRDNLHGSTLTFVMSMEDQPGMLSLVMKTLASYGVNILTIHQTIPVNGVASLTISVEILPGAGDSSEMIAEIERLQGVRYLKILARG